MGVKDFSKVFDYTKEVTYKELNGKCIVIDASVEIYRAALGMKMSETLTNSFGVPTMHINVIYLNILKLKAAGAEQFWIFDKPNDNNEECHNPLKQLELMKRKNKKIEASKKIVDLKDKMKALMNDDNSDKDELFSDMSEEETEAEPNTKKPGTDPNTKKHENSIVSKKEKKVKEIAEIQSNIDKQEKAAFVMKKFYFEDVIFILDMLDIPWIEAPAGFDAEQVAAEATRRNIFSKRMDYVFSSDMDSLLFGARILLKKVKGKGNEKKLLKYDLANLLNKYNLSQDNLIKIGLILGTDFAAKTPRVGPKTVLKKFSAVELTDEQKKAMSDNFKRKLTKEEIDNIVIHNENETPFSNSKKYKQLLDWMQLVKNFNRENVMKQFAKQNLECLAT